MTLISKEQLLREIDILIRFHKEEPELFSNDLVTSIIKLIELQESKEPPK